ncbi:hypothetical protein [Brevibacillus dissolubilis]|uniref:hypothetical protein n=1 Tax=Brevibacillus dissolubilis TaxID=1844116 RepID=UPI0011167B3E|nr:hypothetical protein [Brevibacillus dissolubilis]
MKKNIMKMVALGTLGLVVGVGSYQLFKTDVAIGYTSSRQFENIGELHEKAKLIVTGEVVTQQVEPMQNEQLGITMDALTKTTFKINKVYKNDKTTQFKPGDEITVYEPAGIVEEGIADTYFSTDGYRLMEKDATYLLFLESGVKQGDWVVYGYQGKYNIDKKDRDEAKFLQGHYKVRFDKLQREAKEKYDSFAQETL